MRPYSDFPSSFRDVGAKNSLRGVRMASFPYLDIAIGISFIYLLMALACSTVNETIAGILNSRGKTLEKGVASLLHDPALKEKFFNHPLIRGIQEANAGRLPSYIAPDKFALAMMDILTGPNAAANDPSALRTGVDNLLHADAKTALTAVLQNPQFKTDQQRLAAWYEQGMNRVSGWYKRSTQIRVFALATAVTLFMNADSLRILRTLWDNPTMSAVLVENAKGRLQKGRPDAEGQPMVTYDNPDDPTASTPTEIPEKDVITAQEKQLLGQVTGWQGDWYSDWPDHKTAGFWPWIWYLLVHRLGGWLITILAVSLGAPFWFDTLSKFMNVRNSGKPPEQTPLPQSTAAPATTPPTP